MVTKFGKALRNIRLDNCEILYDMAIKTNISSSTLSGYENCRYRIPDEFVRNIADIYNLSEEKIDELLYLADESNKLRIDMENGKIMADELHSIMPQTSLLDSLNNLPESIKRKFRDVQKSMRDEND